MSYYQLHINTKIFKGSCRKMLLNVNNCLLETQLVSDVKVNILLLLENKGRKPWNFTTSSNLSLRRIVVLLTNVLFIEVL